MINNKNIQNRSTVEMQSNKMTMTFQNFEFSIHLSGNLVSP